MDAVRPCAQGNFRIVVDDEKTAVFAAQRGKPATPARDMFRIMVFRPELEDAPNIDSDSRLAMTAAIRKTFAEKPAEFDPRKYLGPARDNMEKLYKHKILNVLGSDNKLAQ